jgi:chaperone modulatory protein CbpM
MIVKTTEFGLVEICQALELSEQTCLELVEHGILSPAGGVPEEWTFDLHMVSIARRATRLHRDLDLEWSAVAILLDLLEQRERLQQENRLLQQRLRRFIQD